MKVKVTKKHITFGNEWYWIDFEKNKAEAITHCIQKQWVDEDTYNNLKKELLKISIQIPAKELFDTSNRTNLIKLIERLNNGIN